MNVQAKIPTTNDAVRLKLEVNGHAGAFDRQSVSKEFRLAAKKQAFVVRYKTKNGGWACIWEQSGDDPSFINSYRQVAQRRAEVCQALGFETKSPVDKVNPANPFKSTYYRMRVYARAQAELERAFDTEQQARAFRGKILTVDWVSHGDLFDIKIEQH
jgi:hypothetical protein